MAGVSHRLHRGSFMCPLYFIEEYFLMALSGFMVPIAFPLSVTHVKYSYHLLWFQSCLWFKRVSMFPFHWISTGLKAPSSTHKPVQRRYSATSSLSAVLDGLSKCMYLHCMYLHCEKKVFTGQTKHTLTASVSCSWWNGMSKGGGWRSWPPYTELTINSSI